MRKLIVEEWLSLDGYAEDRNGKLDFFPSGEKNRYSDQDQLKFMESIDTILLGRKTYELFVDFWPTASSDVEIVADKLNSISKIVFSNTLGKAPWGKWPEAKVVKGNAADEIRRLKRGNGKDMVLWGSLSLAQSLIKENLIDEYHIKLCPTAVGGGRAFFPDMDVYKDYKLTDVRRYESGLMHLNYAPK